MLYRILDTACSAVHFGGSIVGKGGARRWGWESL